VEGALTNILEYHSCRQSLQEIMVRARDTAPARYVEAVATIRILRHFQSSIQATKVMSFLLTLENAELITNGDSVLSEIKPFDRDQLVEYG
jgi:hypothetical protein